MAIFAGGTFELYYLLPGFLMGTLSRNLHDNPHLTVEASW